MASSNGAGGLGFRTLLVQMTVRGIVTTPLMADGIHDPNRPGEVLRVELCRDEEGTAALRRPGDDEVFPVEDLPPFAHLRLIEPPTDDEGRQLLSDIIAEGLPIASPLAGNA